MFKIRGIVLCALLALVAGEAQAARVAKVEGTITAVNAVSVPPTVTIAGASGDVTLKVAASTRIDLGHGERGSILDLTAGSEAEAQFDVRTQIAKRIKIEETDENATVVGVVVSADPVSGVVTLDTTNDDVVDLTLDTNAETKIKVAGVVLTGDEIAALVDLRVRVEYLTETFLATEIEAGDNALVSAHGTVTAVDAEAGTLAIETTAGPLTFEVAEEAEIRRGGQRVELSALQVGDTVHVAYLEGEPNLAIRVVAQPPRPLHITGTITAVDLVDGSITVSRGATSLELFIDAETDLRINGRAATLADVETAVAAGRRVKVSASYFLAADVALADNIRVNAQSRGRR